MEIYFLFSTKTAVKISDYNLPFIVLVERQFKKFYRNIKQVQIPNILVPYPLINARWIISLFSLESDSLYHAFFIFISEFTLKSECKPATILRDDLMIQVICILAVYLKQNVRF